MRPRLTIARDQLAPTGTLRVGLNLANPLLINRGADLSGPSGIAPDMARELARRLGVPVSFVPYETPGELAAAANADEWDVGLIGADPLRAAEISFTSAYLLIDATYLVPPGSPIRALDEVDREGVRIALFEGSAYDLYLRRTLRHATLRGADSIEASFRIFASQGLEALAGLRPCLLAEQERMPGSRLLDGGFTAIQQAIGTPVGRTEGAEYLQHFVEDVVSEGLVGLMIGRNDVQGVTVAALGKSHFQ
ncbi:Bacterial extracellular solute-binding protein, family 3 [compost metagenome]